jgi:hypothetical protein
VPYADPAWQPQIIVIKLLTDLADVKPDGKWRNVEELLADYVKAYGDFIALLHRRSPSAAILIHWFDARLQPDPNAMRAVNAMQQNITDAAHKAGVARIEFVVMPEDLGLEVSACYHFTLKDHQKIAAWWIDYLDARPELWQGK